ncbi:lytic transglycosylase domain-containing protein [Methylophilus sp. 5]|uniref:lytic transglycosylase domain-containing protein n=1 Tax=Methylophilus sp. 5 TaxID=1112274 RepID=UPI00049076C9|nr:lytic transglycosylase domain-containing protein [Methylophilus sp. 5]
MQLNIPHTAARRTSLWFGWCVALACAALLPHVTHAEELADELAEPLSSDPQRSTETAPASEIRSLVETTHLPQVDAPAPGFSREQSTLRNEAYKQFIKLQVSLAAGTKNALGLTSYEQAHAHYCTLAGESRDPDAQFAMGWFYSAGKGVAVNHDIAARFFSLAAIQGHRDARVWLDNEPGNAELAVLPACMLKQGNSAAEVLFRKRGPIYQLVKKHAPVYGVDVDFAMAVIAVESGFNPKATSRKKAQGLMQLLPDTQARFHVKDAYDPEQNIKGGLSYLRWLISYFKGDVELVAAAYNAGEHAVQRHQGIPPYPETRDYVKRIGHYYKKKHHEVKQKSAMYQANGTQAAS